LLAKASQQALQRGSSDATQQFKRMSLAVASSLSDLQIVSKQQLTFSKR
jgi:hypothetical protein